MIINLTNNRYGVTGQFDISRNSWIKHTEMHPKRPEEALQNNLSICYGINTPVTSSMIEKVIKDEYNESQNLTNKIMEARKIDDIAKYSNNPRLTENNDNKKFHLREMIDEAKRLGRPLTDREAQKYLVN